MQHFELWGRSILADLTGIRIRPKNQGDYMVLHVSAGKSSATCSRTCHLGYGRSCGWMVL
jgi:hypothetical protein